MFDYLVLQKALRADDVFEEGFAHMRVYGTERIVQQVDIVLAVHRTRQTHALLLPTAQVDTLHVQERKSN